MVWLPMSHSCGMSPWEAREKPLPMGLGVEIFGYQGLCGIHNRPADRLDVKNLKNIAHFKSRRIELPGGIENAGIVKFRQYQQGVIGPCRANARWQKSSFGLGKPMLTKVNRG